MRMRIPFAITSAVMLFALVLSPVAAEAQSSIAGQVVDNTGGLLPGTTGEAASPALIEGSRVVVTDGQGRYAIVGLEPGLYTVTFSLTGFSTFVREGIELPASFTASVDATLTVGRCRRPSRSPGCRQSSTCSRRRRFRCSAARCSTRFPRDAIFGHKPRSSRVWRWPGPMSVAPRGWTMWP